MFFNFFNGLNNDIRSALIGTASSGVSAFLLLPLTNELIRRQTNLERTRKDSIKEISDPRYVSRLGGLSGRAVAHAVTRSFTTLGIANIVFQRMKDDPSAAKRGFYAGIFAGFSQGVLTTWFSHSIISGLAGQPLIRFKDMLCDRRLIRNIYPIALIKNTLDQGLAIMLSQIIKQYLSERDAPLPGPVISFISGSSAAAISSLFAMPLIQAETNALAQPTRALREWGEEIKQQVRKDPRILWRGCAIRIARASSGLGVGLVFTDLLNDCFNRFVVRR